MRREPVGCPMRARRKVLDGREASGWPDVYIYIYSRPGNGTHPTGPLIWIFETLPSPVAHAAVREASARCGMSNIEPVNEDAVSLSQDMIRPTEDMLRRTAHLLRLAGGSCDWPI